MFYPTSKKFLSQLETHFQSNSYIHGFVATEDDLTAFRGIGHPPDESTFPNVARYFAHMRTFTPHELKQLPVPHTTLMGQGLAMAAELCDSKTQPEHAPAVPVPSTMIKHTDTTSIVPSGFKPPKFDEFAEHRKNIWEKLKQKQPQVEGHGSKAELTSAEGKKKEGVIGVTTPFDCIKDWCDKSAWSSFVVAKVDGKLWDLSRPIEKEGEIQFLTFDDEEAREVFWHSSAHIMGEALERVFGGNLTKGPPTDNGFFYDIYLGQEKSVVEGDYKTINTTLQKVVKEKQPFERILVSKQDGLELFKFNPFKKEIIQNKVPDDAMMSVYRCGDLIDPCRGPHISNTSVVKAIEVTKNSSAYWEGKAGKDSLQRVYGVSFPTKDRMKEWKHLQEEAKKRDHRKIGKDQELFFFEELSPGSCFWLPHGARVYNKLMDHIKQEYWKRGFDEVVTPNIYSMKLWETSGHATKYRDNMFSFDVEGNEFALKPMNCPGHCLMFAHRIRSWRELPIRLADFGVLHRNELSGALHGLTRVRRFQQDDAHIFCMSDQIKEEIVGALDFLNAVYGVFGFTYTVNLSTRPEQYLGELEVWDSAEKALEEALNSSGMEWQLNPGDGAFYGPKIDITLTDALKRPHQCGTIQLDFQLPIRFGLQYSTTDKEDKPVQKRPVIIHRAILGSVERFTSIITEQFAGKWPFWLSPRQAIVVPIAPAFHEYAERVRNILHDEQFFVDVDLSAKKFNKKVREAQVAQYNFILVVGEDEMNEEAVNVRTRDNNVHGKRAIPQLLEEWRNYMTTKTGEV